MDAENVSEARKQQQWIDGWLLRCLQDKTRQDKTCGISAPDGDKVVVWLLDRLEHPAVSANPDVVVLDEVRVAPAAPHARRRMRMRVAKHGARHSSSSCCSCRRRCRL
eukprot:COSAG06_NODE_1039_length_10995_cov_47.088106_2_plen_108_part_00